MKTSVRWCPGVVLSLLWLAAPAAGVAQTHQPLAPAPPAAAVAALSETELAAKVGDPKDEGPHNVRRHYMWSNERRHDLFYSGLAGLGGGYLGVGGDQNYSMAAAAGAKVVWLIDLDVAVVRMHRLYAALLTVAETPQAFLSLLDRHHKQAVYDAVAAYHSALPEEERRAVLAVYHAYREELADHLHRTAGFRWGGKHVTWLGDEAMYATIRKLAQARLLVPRLGDLTGPSTVLEIAAAARAASVPVHAIYLSNAESWFRYGREFRRNITALPVDDRSLVLRTVKSVILTYPHGDIWHYNLQRADHFAQHLGELAYAKVDVAMVDAEPWYNPGPGAALAPPKKSQLVRGLSTVGFAHAAADGAAPAVAATPATGVDPARAARQQRKREREAKERREQLLAAGLVTRPEGNRVHARTMDREAEKRVARELADSTPTRP